jgi:hypothetical protein
VHGGRMKTWSTMSSSRAAAGADGVARLWTEGTRSKLEKLRSTFLGWRVGLTLGENGLWSGAAARFGGEGL